MVTFVDPDRTEIPATGSATAIVVTTGAAQVIETVFLPAPNAAALVRTNVTLAVSIGAELVTVIVKLPRASVVYAVPVVEVAGVISAEPFGPVQVGVAVIITPAAAVADDAV